ncbi:ligand-binding sensor domain-containing diguanylate cyclase [Sulfidibacter corallicola]|uniref:diguanylate cyclase n=1 Tax=Sulfidibacter corallicola TaxID=2818388 RepID=A0A8A4TVX8_SULCO|nr:ligand-binding sensor domain-containing diguanylate cyclase [Sulfidibacter corallicola]QTD54099.1 diguanylate cyclase [Sulfidibacter corallicola]
MLRKNVLVLVVGGWFLIGLPLFGLDPDRVISQYIHEVWQDDRGLPQNTVNVMIQDRVGYLWLGTQEGLARFDGLRFANISRKSLETFPIKEINALYEASDGTLWMAGPGQNLVSLKNREVGSYSLGSQTRNTFINALCEDDRGWIWMGTNRGLLRLNPGDGSLVPFPPDYPLADVPVKCLVRDRKGKIWIGSYRGLFTYEGGTLEPFPLELRRDDVPISALAFGEGDSLWIGTEGWGLHLLADGKITKGYTRAEGLQSNQISALVFDRDKNLWVGTNRGVNRLNQWGISVFSLEQGLSFPSVLSLLEDREGNLWIGTLGGGVNQLRNGKFLSITQTEGLPGNETICVAEDPDGRMWVGTAGFGVSVIDENGVTTDRRADGLPSNFVLSLLSGPDGVMWAGTDGGLAEFENGTWRQPAWAEQLEGSFIRALHRDRLGALWIGSQSGLEVYDGSRVTNFRHHSQFSISTVRAIAEDREGRIWVGSRNGLFLFVDGKPVVEYGPESGLDDTFILSLFFDHEGVLWVGSNSEGLFRMKDDRFIRIDEPEGLFNSSVFHIQEDEFHRFWMTCNLGLYTVPRDQLIDFTEGRLDRIHCTAFDEADGMPSRECIGVGNTCGIRAQSGDIWIPTIKGLIRIDPKQTAQWFRPAPVVVESLFADERRFDLSGGEVQLPPGSDKLRLTFTSLRFEVSERIRFRYRLEGYDSDWTHVRDLRTAYYNNLSPGSYSFQVQADRGDGVFMEPGASLSFYLRPHFYQTAWFYGLMILLAGLVVFGAYRFKVRRFQVMQAHLEALVKERTLALTASNQALAESSTKLQAANRKLRQLTVTDPLTGLKNRRYLKEIMVAETSRFAKRTSPEGERRGQVAAEYPTLIFIMIDLDHFKSFNDRFGHNAGDMILSRVGELLRETCRDTDIVFRWGGEEFLLLFRDAEEDSAAKLAERIRTLISSTAIDLDNGQQVHITTSLGFALFPFLSEAPTAFTWEEVINLADHALYAAKYSGRNAWVGLRPGSRDLDRWEFSQIVAQLPTLTRDGTLLADSSFTDRRELVWKMSN